MLAGVRSFSFIPYVIAGVMFFINLLLKDIFQRRKSAYFIGPFKLYIVVQETHDNGALALLGKAVMQGIMYFPLHFIAKVFQGFKNAGERSTTVMCGKLFNVFQHNHGWRFLFKNLHDFKEKRTTDIIKALALANNAERLARKACTQQVMVRHGMG